MPINRVDYGTTTLIDISADTVLPDKLLKDYTAHQADGTSITGTLEVQPLIDTAVSDTLTEIANGSY